MVIDDPESDICGGESQIIGWIDITANKETNGTLQLIFRNAIAIQAKCVRRTVAGVTGCD